MEVAIMVFQVLLALSILIVLHEGGHYLAARMFGIKVEKFYLFFDAGGKKIFSFKKGDTEYGMGWLPLGGYVKIAGMIDESMDKDQLKEEPKEWEFRSKPAWQRLIVMLGGVIVNLILGVVIFWFMTAYYGEQTLPIENANKMGIHALELGKEVGFKDGDKLIAVNGVALESFSDIASPDALLASEVVYKVERDGEEMNITMPPNFIDLYSEKGKNNFLDFNKKFEVGVVTPGSNAEKSGLKAGDKIIAVNGNPVSYFYEFNTIMKPDFSFDYVVLREGKEMSLKGETGKDGLFGFQASFPGLEDEFKMVKYGFWESLPLGYKKGVETIETQLKGFQKMFKGELNARKSLSGPIGLAKIFGGEIIWQKFWGLTALFSLVLAFMNLLPIPALDGGHAVFCIVEMITGKTLSDKWMQYVQMAGMIILLTLMVFIFGNDILKLMGI